MGDSYDTSLAESIIGLYKIEVIRRWGPWKNLEAVEWVVWFNTERLHSSIKYLPHAAFEAMYCARRESSTAEAGRN